MIRQSIVGHVPFQVTSLDAATTQLIQAAEDSGTVIRLANSFNVAVASRDASYFKLMTERGVNLPDGLPIVLMQRLLGDRPARQVRGPALFREVLDRGRKHGTRHFLIGMKSADELRMLCQSIELKYPGAAIVGAISPPFHEASDFPYAEWVEEISRMRAQVVWIGLGSPKQDYVAAQLHELTGCVAVGVGAAFSFVAGTTREAPILVRRLGLEWLFRLCSEPRRLWRRYAFGIGVYLALCARDLSIAVARRMFGSGST